MYSWKLQYNGNTVTSAGGSFVRFDYKSPYFVFEFSVSDFVPTSDLINSEYTGTWTQVSSSPNRWKLTIDNFVEYYSGATNLGIGLAKLFTPEASGENLGYLIPSRLGGGTCKLIDSGNLNIVDLNGNTCQTMDRLFFGCKGLTYIEPIQCSNVQNVGGMFQGCDNVTEGALAQYTWFNTYGININNHSGTFSNCGSNTQTGAAELAQIPTGWGGTLVPASTLMTSTAGGYNKYTCWTINSNNPTWTDVKNGMYLFTETSVSKYAGVSMNRSRINGKHNSLNTAQATAALYFYPAFIQVNGVKAPGATSADLTWLVTTNTPNGSLAKGQANRDMPGTLDYGTYGTFTREYGTYDSSKAVFFLFLVTNVPIVQWNGFTDAYGFLYNGNYLTDAKLRWFFET